MNRVKITISACVASLACGAWAIGEGRPPGAEFYPEQTQEVVRAQQLEQTTMGEVGVVPENTREESASDVATTPGADATVALASDPEATAALRSAEATVPSKGFAWWGLAAFAAFGAGGAWGVRRWLAANVPPMPAPSRRSRW